MEAIVELMIDHEDEQAKSSIDEFDCVSATDGIGRTLLHLSVLHGRDDVAKYLLEKGCDVDAQDSNGSTPLMIAVSHNQGLIVETLLTAGADINILNQDNKSAIYMAFYPIYASSSIINLILTAVKQRLSAPEEIAEFLISSGCKDLYPAVFFRNAAVIEHLIFRGVSVNTTTLRRALNVAVEFGDIKIVKFLLEYGTDTLDTDGMLATIVYYLYPKNAKRTSEKLEILKLLLNLGASPTSLMGNGLFQMCCSMFEGEREEIRLLLQCNIHVTAKDQYFEATVLHYIALNYHVGVAEELKCYLDANKIDVNVVDAAGKTPLMRATLSGNSEMVKLFLEKGSEVNLTSTIDGYSVLFYIFQPSYRLSEMKLDECLELVLRYGADPQFVANTPDGQTTLIELASKQNTLYRMKKVVAHIAMIESRGIMITEITRSQMNAHSSLKEYYEECGQVLNTEITSSVNAIQLMIDSEQKISKYIDDEFIQRKNDLMENKVKLSYPYYYKIAEERYHKARQYKEAALAICEIFGNGIDVGHLAVRAITDCLGDQGLLNLSGFYKKYASKCE